MGTLPSGLAEVVGDDEGLARFLTSSSQFNSVMVKPSTFLPNPKDRETSVFRHGAEPREALWQIGLENVRDRKVYGAALVKARQVRAALLEVAATEPPPRHAGLVGWPWLSDPELQKAAQKERAALIARVAQLLLQ